MAGEAPQAPRAGLDHQAKVALLKQPATYPERPRRIDVIETHMSWVFLTERHAYKLKKPVRYEFLDFSTLAARRENCAEELRLNRRLAPDVYLGTVALTVDPRGRVQLGGSGEVIDWLVAMRRLPAERMLDEMIRRGTAQEADVRRIADVLSAFYRASPPITLAGADYRAQLDREIDANQSALADPFYDLDGAPVLALHKAQRRFLRSHADEIDRRVAAGRIVEGHGDLRPEHICLEPTPVIFDCLEFNRQFRILDTADELSFLAMECERLGAPFVGRVLFEAYGEQTGDRPPEDLLDFYKTYRACLRAKLALWHLRDRERDQWPKWQARAGEYLRLAQRYAGRLP